jgi:hypothetical protein
MTDELYDSPELRKLIKTVWPDEATARAHRTRARDVNLDTLCFEARCVFWALEESHTLIDEAAVAGMRRYLDETRMIVAAMPANDVGSLRAKLAALGTLAPLASAHGHLTLMIKAALREDLRKIEIANPPDWFCEEEAERSARANAGRPRSRRRKAQNRQRSDEPGAMTPTIALEILGLKTDASAAEIRAAHQRFIRFLHPDRGGSTYLAARVNAARDALIQSG